MRHLFNLFFIIGLISFFSNSSVYAQEKKKTKKNHRHHEAHMHGAGKMSIAFDGTKGRIELVLAAESILGFEYRPKTDRDIIILSNATRTFQMEFGSMVQFDPTLGCLIKPDQVEQKMNDQKSSHSDFKASYNIECKKSLLKSTIKFDFSRYDSIKDIDVTVLVDKLQKNFEISNRESSIELK